MLYTYKNINHDFAKIHKFVEHLVLEVWCKPNGNYSHNRLHVDFVPIVKGIKDKKLLAEPIHEIYNIFKQIYNNDKASFRKLKNGFIANNSIQELCRGNKSPLLYSQIETINKKLKTKLQKFFKDLYTKVPLQAAFKKVCGSMKSYYDDFLDTNDSEVCPFCGISEIMTSRLSKRDAFDHYLPKDIYPFNSVNPNNLAPICKTCNSSYKLARDPIKKGGRKRKAFYPFANKSVKLNIIAKFKCSNVTKLKTNEVTLSISNASYKEEVDTWKDLFGIQERFIDKFCSKEARWWRIQMMDELKNTNKLKGKRFQDKLKLFENNYMVDKNFLKIAYLKACNDIGVI